MESPLAQALLNFLIIGGPSSVLYVGARGFWRWYTGKAGRERIRTRTIADERDIARNERDDADAYRRVISEYASLLRGILFENGLGALVPDWPKNPAETKERRPHDEGESRRHARRRREQS